MAQASLTTEQKQEAVDAVVNYGSQNEAARRLGLNRATFLHRYRAGIKAGLDQAIVHPAPQGHTVKGVSSFYSGDGVLRGQWVKTKANEPSLDDIIETVREALADYESAGTHIAEPGYVDAQLATVFPLPDLHFGLYAFGRETGEDYDLNIAEETNRKAFTRLMVATPSSEAAVILGLGDLLHADDASNRTAKSGHALDVDTRHSKVLKTAIQFMIFAAELAMTKHRHVTVRNLPGNHDTHSAMAVTMALWAWFRDNPRITVDDSPSYFWWWRWGQVLLGATHGDMAKPANLPLVMAASRPEDWGQTKHRLVLTGHIHTRTALESGGVIVESFQSTAARDAWHEASGYRAGRSLSAITFHSVDGEIARQKVNIV
jgi:hypothetical protein